MRGPLGVTVEISTSSRAFLGLLCRLEAVFAALDLELVLGGRSRHFGEVTVDLSAALHARVSHLHGSLVVDGDGTVGLVGALTRELKQAVPSYLALQRCWSTTVTPSP